METFNRGANRGLLGAQPAGRPESPARPAASEPGRGVELSLPPGPREFAALLDAMLVITAVFVIRLILELLPIGDPYAMVALPMHLVGVAGAFLCYLVTSEVFFGRTLGKILLGLRVQRRREDEPALKATAGVPVRANFFPAVIRALTFAPDLMALLLFGTAHLLRGRAFGMSRMGDIYADTVVVADTERRPEERVATGMDTPLVGELPDEVAPCVQFEHEFLRDSLEEIMAAAGDGTRRPYVFLSSITELPEGVIEDICVVSESGLWAVGLARPGLPTATVPIGASEHPAAYLRLVREDEGADQQPGQRPMDPQAARHSYQTALAQFRQSATLLTDLSKGGEGAGEGVRQFNVALLVPVADYESYGLDEVEGVVSAGRIGEIFAPDAPSSGQEPPCRRETERIAGEIYEMSYLLPVMSPEERTEDKE